MLSWRSGPPASTALRYSAMPAEAISRIERGLEEGVGEAEVAPPGFLNLRMTQEWYGEAVAEILDVGTDYGAGSAAQAERVQVELVSPNPTGPLTVASARNGAYGDAV